MNESQQKIARHVTVAPEQAGERLDKLLAAAFPELSRTRIQSLLSGGHITAADQKPRDGKYKVKAGEEYIILVPPSEPSVIRPVKIPLNIVYEDEHLIVLDKPPQMTVHPGAGTQEDTLVHALLAHAGTSLSGIGGVARPGLVHRLDRDTSGLMVIAKHDVAHRKLAQQLKSRWLKRHYLALCWGTPEPRIGTVRTNLTRSPENRRKMKATAKDGKHAVTHYVVKKVLLKGLASLVECKLETGRTHQIRVHMEYLGHSIMGDPIYIDQVKKYAPKFPPNLLNYIPSRQCLHSYKLILTHPYTEEILEFQSPLPADIEKLYNVLKSEG